MSEYTVGGRERGWGFRKRWLKGFGNATVATDFS